MTQLGFFERGSGGEGLATSYTNTAILLDFFFPILKVDMLSTLSPATLSRLVWEISLLQAIKSRGENYHTTSSQQKMAGYR